MIEKLWNDPLFSFLLENGILTGPQVDTILASNTAAKLDEKVSLRAKGRVSKGAFLRTLRQGERNIQASVYTLLLVRYLHLLDSSMWGQLVRIGELMDKAGSAGVDGSESPRLVQAMKSFVARLSTTERL